MELDFESLKAQNNQVDDFTHPDFYEIDNLLTEEHKLIRDSVRQLGEERDFSHNRCVLPGSDLPSAYCSAAWVTSVALGRKFLPNMAAAD